MKRRSAALYAAAAALLSVPPTIASAQAPNVTRTFVHLAQGVPGVLYEPAYVGPKAQIAVFVMHSTADYLSHSACTELSARGYRVLCANNSTGKSGVSNDGILDRVLLDAKAGVAYLRKRPGIRKIVLLGHSGGGTVMTAYQMIAEGGAKACQAPEKIWKCPATLDGLPPADGVVLADSNWGLAEMTLFSTDPAVIEEDNGIKLDARLDMFNPANGFRPTGSSYSWDFTRKFLSAEQRRSARLLDRAQASLAAIEAGHGQFADDEPFVVPGATLVAGNNRLFSQDVRLMSHTRQAWPVVQPDGSEVIQVVHTVRVPENTKSLSPMYLQGALKTTVRNYLNNYAIRTTPQFSYDEDSVSGVDWTSTYASPPGNVQGISVPLLTLGMTGHWEFLASETIYGLAKSKDKTLAFIDGANHLYETCKPCERTPGQFGNTRKTTYDYIDKWLSKPGRFIN